MKITKTNINITTQASAVDEKYIYVKCPICFRTKYSKKHAYHKFNSYLNTDNRVEILTAKCNGYDTMFFVEINNATARTGIKV